jgi:hypothetical protein
VVEFIFERKQTFKVVVVDCDNADGTSFDALGNASFDMGQLVGSSNGMLILPLLEKNQNMGNVIVRSERVSTNNDILSLNLCLNNVPGGGCFSSNKVFLEISKPRLNIELRQKLA